MRALAVAAGALLLAATSVARADSYPSAVRNACTPDAKRLCPAYKLGTPEMRSCMEGRYQSFSRSCLIALEDAGYVPRGTVNRRR